MEASRFPCARFGRAPLALRQHPVLLVILDFALAMLTDVDGKFGRALGPTDLGELENLPLVAQRTRHPVVALIAVLETRLDAAAAGDLGRGDHEDLPASEGARPS